MKNLLLLFILLISINLKSQNNLKDLVNSFTSKNQYFNKYQEELFFLHTNKTTYFSGEDIWFAAYVFDKQTEKPSLYTKNLHLNLYDQNYKLVDQKLYFVNKGKAHGKFKLPKKLKSGSYYIVVDTNWNKNFKEGLITKIEIINLNKPDSGPVDYEIVHSLEEKVNKNQIIHNKEEFLIRRNSKHENSSIFNFNTTTNIINKYKGNVLFAVLHKEDILSSCAPIIIDHKKKYTVKFDSILFFNGVNTITLFDKKNHVIANKHFWNFDSKVEHLQINKKIKKNDTLFLYLKSPENIRKGTLSISILAEENKFISSKSTILKSFIDPNFNKIKANSKLLENYLNSKKSSLFPKKHRKKTKKTYFKQETGITISGKLISKIRKTNGYKIAMTSKENEIFLVANLNNDMTFKFENLYLKHLTKYSLALLNKNKKIQNSKFYIYDNYYNYIAVNSLKNQKNLSNESFNLSKNTLDKLNYTIGEDVIDLEEVVINSFIDKEKKILDKYKNIRAAGFTNFYVPNDNLAIGTDIFQYLQNVPGLRVYYPPLTNSPLIFNTRGQSSITGGQLVNVQLNGIPLGEELDPLVGLLTTDFEIIMVNLSGAGEGLRGSNGVVNLILKNSNDDNSKRKSSKIKYKETRKGFEVSPEKYKKSNIVFDTFEQQKNYETIDWLPNVNIEYSKPTVLKIPILKGHKNLKLTINGFDKNGILIHNNFIISTD